MHHTLIVEKNSVWIKASRVIIHVVGYLVKACAWHGLGVVVVLVVVFVFELRAILFFSVDLICLMVDMHT